MRASLLRSRSGTAAAEMALVTPLLMVIMFGAMELGYYFYSEHIVVKAVRDGARYASRQSFAKYGCPDENVDGDVVTTVRNVTRTNQVAPGGTPRLAYWDNGSTIDVAVRCEDADEYGAFYTGMNAVPVVVVTATVPYQSLFSMIGFDARSLNLNATSEVPVMGV
ncbi:MAG TPA: TadE family protein [Sphingomicrobium sp.]|jgi:Flp pilus assembly protein TadG|nr:TadE family protein [Sphingomicrobium sp.]